jgi:hypothetical protein
VADVPRGPERDDVQMSRDGVSTSASASVWCQLRIAVAGVGLVEGSPTRRRRDAERLAKQRSARHHADRSSLVAREDIIRRVSPKKSEAVSNPKCVGSTSSRFVVALQSLPLRGFCATYPVVELSAPPLPAAPSLRRRCRGKFGRHPPQRMRRAGPGHSRRKGN